MTVLLNGCATPPSITTTAKALYAPYAPVNPRQSFFVTYYDKDGKMQTKAWSDMQNSEIRTQLPNILSEITVSSSDNNGHVSYLINNASVDVGHYDVTFDFMKYVVQSALDKATKKTIGYGRIGVALRMTASLDTTTAKVNLGSLFAIGAAAEASSLNGNLQVQAVGINATDSEIPSNVMPISQTSIQTVLQSLAVLKSKISDSQTVLTPYVLSVKSSDPSHTSDEVSSALSDSP